MHTTLGLAREHIDLVNRDVGGVIIQHDLISYLGLQLEAANPSEPISYLEIGVSVAKCLFTQINFFPSSASIVAVRLMPYCTVHIFKLFIKHTLKLFAVLYTIIRN